MWAGHVFQRFTWIYKWNGVFHKYVSDFLVTTYHIPIMPWCQLIHLFICIGIPPLVLIVLLSLWLPLNCPADLVSSILIAVSVFLFVCVCVLRLELTQDIQSDSNPAQLLSVGQKLAIDLYSTGQCVCVFLCDRRIRRGFLPQFPVDSVK